MVRASHERNVRPTFIARSSIASFSSIIERSLKLSTMHEWIWCQVSLVFKEIYFEFIYVDMVMVGFQNRGNAFLGLIRFKILNCNLAIEFLGSGSFQTDSLFLSLFDFLFLCYSQHMGICSQVYLGWDHRWEQAPYIKQIKKAIAWDY